MGSKRYATASGEGIAFTSSSGNTVIDEETVQLADEAKYAEGNITEAGAMSFSDVVGNINTGIGGDNNEGAIILGDGSSYIHEDMSTRTYDMIDSWADQASTTNQSILDLIYDGDPTRPTQPTQPVMQPTTGTTTTGGAVKGWVWGVVVLVVVVVGFLLAKLKVK